MNRRLLMLTLASAALLVTGWTVLAFTCEDKATTAQTAAAQKGGKCTAEMAAQCTPAQAAACKAKMSNAAMTHACAGKSAAVTAANSTSACGSSKATAVTATAGEHSCAGMRSAVTASNGAHSCAGMKTAMTAANGAHSCASMSAAAQTADYAGCPHDSKGAASANASTCRLHGAGMAGASGLEAVFAGGPGCSNHASMARGEGDHHCDACADMMQCDSEIKAAGGTTQVVRLKNGVMFIHTASGAAHVRAIQAALTRRSDRLMAIAASGDRAKLCPECRTMRGAMASGKLNREMVTIEGGCLTLMTSNDRSVIAKLHAMAGEEMARTKS